MLSMLARAGTRTPSRPAVRYLTAALAAAAALIYALIGLQAVSVIEPMSDQTVFGVMAAGAYALGAILLLMVERRIVWALGALFQVFVILQYVNVASERTPSYEGWGITLRIIQALLLIGLVYLMVRPPFERTVSPPVDSPSTPAAA